MRIDNETKNIEQIIAEHLVKKINFKPSDFFKIKYTLGIETNLEILNEIDLNIIKSLIGSDKSSLDVDYEKVGEFIAKWCLSDVYRSVRNSEIKLARELEHTDWGFPSGDHVRDECYWGIYFESLKHLNFTEIAKRSIKLILTNNDSLKHEGH